MTLVEGYFDELEFWDTTYFGKPIVKDTKLIIPARNIKLYEDHPLNTKGEPILLTKSNLIFSGVQKSERVISEYIGTPKSGQGFKPSYKVVDGLFAKTNEPTNSFYLEGILEEPLSYVTWEIESSFFYLEIFDL